MFLSYHRTVWIGVLGSKIYNLEFSQKVDSTVRLER